MQQIDVQRKREITRQPGEQQVEDVVIGAEADGETEYLAPQEKTAQRSLSYFRGPSQFRAFDGFLDQVALDPCQPRIIVRVFIHAPEIHEIGDADKAGRSEERRVG